MNAKRATTASCFALTFVALACTPGDTTNTSTASGCLNCGSAGSGSGGTTSSSTTSGSGGSGSGGSTGLVCTPSVLDPDCTANPAYTSCECAPMSTTTQEWCDMWAQQSIQICNPAGNTCEVGSNMCGYDLPIGEAYQVADPQCQLFVQGDTWADQFNNTGNAVSQYNENGQLTIGFTLLTWGSYYNGFSMTGRKLDWNKANAATADSADGVFSQDCKTLMITWHPSSQVDTIYWQHHPQ